MVRHDAVSSLRWHEHRVRTWFDFADGKGVVDGEMFRLQIEDDNAEVFISVHQKDHRILDALNYIDVGVTVLQESDGHYQFIASSGNSAERQNQLEIPSLATGEYLIIPTSTGAKFYHEKQLRSSTDATRSVVLTIHSSEKFSVEEIPFDDNIYEEAMELPAIHQGVTKDLFGDGKVILHTFKSGYAGMSFVAANHTDMNTLRLTLDLSGSDNIISHTGDMIATVDIPPNEAKVMHHIFPADDFGDWSCGWKCKAKWIKNRK
jgi:hypothetical protein